MPVRAEEAVAVGQEAEAVLLVEGDGPRRGGPGADQQPRCRRQVHQALEEGGTHAGPLVAGQHVGVSDEGDGRRPAEGLVADDTHQLR
jgi:hypothetical protein